MTDDKTRVLPQTQVPDPQRPRQARKRRRRRMSRGQRFVLTVLTLLVLFAALAVGAVFLAELQMDDLGTFDSLASGEGTYLVVGTDSRENLPDDLEGKFGDFAGARADVIMLMQVVSDEVQRRSIPRARRVAIPGRGVSDVNAAYAVGGPDLLVETISRETGSRINHCLEVGSGGFPRIVDALGGIELDLPAPARDRKS